MNFEFAKFTEVTSLAHEVNSEYRKNNYTRIFLCPDVKNIWIVRILEGFNEDYREEEGGFIIERNKIHDVIPRMLNEEIAKLILKEDDLSNWDCTYYNSMEDCLESIDGGFGILNLQ